MSEERVMVRFKLTRSQVNHLDKMAAEARDPSRNEAARRLLVRVLEDDAEHHGEPIAVQQTSDVDTGD